MKTLKLWLPLTLLLLLQGCFDGEVGKAKQLALGKDLTFAQYLDDSKNCVKSSWSSFKDEKGNILIKAVCTLDPAQVTLDKNVERHRSTILSDEARSKRHLVTAEENLQRSIADKTRFQESLRRIHGNSSPEAANDQNVAYDKEQLAALLAKKDRVLQQIDAKKEADMRAVDTALKKADQALAAEYLFVVTSDTARLVQLELHVGEDKVYIAPFDASRFLVYAAQGGASMKSGFWQEARGRSFKPDLSLPLEP